MFYLFPYIFVFLSLRSIYISLFFFSSTSNLKHDLRLDLCARESVFEYRPLTSVLYSFLFISSLTSSGIHTTPITHYLAKEDQKSLCNFIAIAKQERSCRPSNKCAEYCVGVISDLSQGTCI